MSTAIRIKNSFVYATLQNLSLGAFYNHDPVTDVLTFTNDLGVVKGTSLEVLGNSVLKANSHFTGTRVVDTIVIQNTADGITISSVVAVKILSTAMDIVSWTAISDFLKMMLIAPALMRQQTEAVQIHWTVVQVSLLKGFMNGAKRTERSNLIYLH